MPRFVVDVIDEHLGLDRPDDAPLFPNHNGGFLTKSNASRGIRRVLAVAGLASSVRDDKDADGGFHIHLSRHWLTDRLIEGGAPAAEVARMLGHSEAVQAAHYRSVEVPRVDLATHVDAALSEVMGGVANEPHGGRLGA